MKTNTSTVLSVHRLNLSGQTSYAHVRYSSGDCLGDAGHLIDAGETVATALLRVADDKTDKAIAMLREAAMLKRGALMADSNGGSLSHENHHSG